jgi:hypothetical protein
VTVEIAKKDRATRSYSRADRGILRLFLRYVEGVSPPSFVREYIDKIARPSAVLKRSPIPISDFPSETEKMPAGYSTFVPKFGMKNDLTQRILSRAFHLVPALDEPKGRLGAQPLAIS